MNEKTEFWLAADKNGYVGMYSQEPELRESGDGYESSGYICNASRLFDFYCCPLGKIRIIRTVSDGKVTFERAK